MHAEANPHPKPDISFCITCKNRLHHLKQTLPQNIANNTHPDGSGPVVQFVVVDYDSEDGMEQWIKDHYRKEIDSGLMKYVKLAHPAKFDMSHAKNVAHRMADGTVLCNLDADNITASGFADWLQQQFSGYASRNVDICIRPNVRISALHKFTKGEISGVNGRIAVSRKHFEAVHGYDETMSTTRSEDSDFVGRLSAIGVKPHDLDFQMYGSVLQHGNDERTANMDTDQKAAVDALLAQGGDLTSRFRRFIRGSHYDVGDKNPVANPDGHCGCAEVYVNFSKTPYTIPPLPPQVEKAAGRGV